MRIYSVEEIETAYNNWADTQRKAIEGGVINSGAKHQFDFNFIRCANGTIPERAQKDYERQFEGERNKATPIIICKCCGFPESLTYYKDVQDKLIKQQYCHTCSFWDDRVESYNGGRILITMDTTNELGYFSLGDATSPFKSTSCNGFSGHEWKITFDDERGVVYTNNMWNGGDIDFRWVDKFKRNGTRVSCGRSEYIQQWIDKHGEGSYDVQQLITRVMHEVIPKATEEEARNALREEGYNAFRAIQCIKNERKSSGQVDTHHS